jgi:hypothetical protein
VKTETKSIEQYLQGVAPPEGGSPRHFEELRGRVLAEIGGRPAPSLASLAWKVAALCVVLAGTAYAGMKLYTYYFEGVGRDGAYHFTTSPQVIESGTDANGNPRVVVRSSSVSIKEWPGQGVEQMQQQLQEVETLRQKGQRELIGVGDTLVNGHPGLRVFQYKYVLSDGTTREINEGGFEGNGRTSEQARQDEAEIARLRAAGQRQIIGVLDIEHNRRIQRLLTCAYTLADGRTQIQRAESDPLVPMPENWLSRSQTGELWRLVRLDQGEHLSTEVRSLYGQTFTFTRRAYDIGGGKVVVMWDGQPQEKWELKAQDYEELRRLSEAGAGELVGTYQGEVKGRLFTFEQRSYTLADGTVVVRAHGKPANN